MRSIILYLHRQDVNVAKMKTDNPTENPTDTPNPDSSEDMKVYCARHFLSAAYGWYWNSIGESIRFLGAHGGDAPPGARGGGVLRPAGAAGISGEDRV